MQSTQALVLHVVKLIPGTLRSSLCLEPLRQGAPSGDYPVCQLRTAGFHRLTLT